MPSQAFSKEHRLLKPADFQSVFDDVELKQGGPHFTFLARKTSLLISRIGIIVSRKSAARAVDRNRIKRLIRESFRKNPLSSETNSTSIDIIIMAKPSSKTLGNASMVTSLEQQWEKLLKKLPDSET